MIRFSALNKEDTISGNSLTAINNNDKAFSLQPTKEAKVMKCNYHLRCNFAYYVYIGISSIAIIS